MILVAICLAGVALLLLAMYRADSRRERARRQGEFEDAVRQRRHLRLAKPGAGDGARR